MHINGPTGVGKSTIARALIAERPLALCLDIDELRVRLGGWRTFATSKQIARDLGFALAREHLNAGRDVVLPQLTVRAEVIDALADIASECRADFLEVILVADGATLAARAHRSNPQSDSHPRDEFTPTELAAQSNYALEALAHIAAQRSDTHVVDTTGMTESDALRAVRSTSDRLPPNQRIEERTSGN